MKLFENINAKSGIRKYSTTTKGENYIEFELNNKMAKKSARGAFFIDKEENLQIVIEDSNYSKNYLKKSILEDFEDAGINIESISVFFEFPKKGDLISVSEFMVEKIGEEVDLPKETEIHSLYGESVQCNGMKLGRNFRAKIIKRLDLRCKGHGKLKEYTFLKLLKELDS